MPCRASVGILPAEVTPTVMRLPGFSVRGLVLFGLLAACSSGGPSTGFDADAASPLDWATWERVEARPGDLPEPQDAPEADAPPAEPDLPEAVDSGPSEPPEPDLVEPPPPEPGPEPSPEPDLPEVALPEPSEVVEAVDVQDVGPESESTPCASATDCDALPHGPCPGWWACAATCAWECPAPLDLYELGDLEDDQQLFAEVLSETEQVWQGQGFRVQEVRFRSFEWVTGSKEVLSIHGFLAHPQSGAPVKPGVVLLTGLEGVASADDAMDLGGRADAVVLALDGPGQGGSLGHGPSSGLSVLFATTPDPRATWFVAYAVAASRGLTWLKAHPSVQPSHLGVVGRRLGGVVALLVNGIDRRVRAAVALEAAGGLPTSARQEGWYKALFAGAGLEPYAAEVDLWASRADPLAYAGFQRGAVLLAVGAQDEYHPLTTTLATYAAITGVPKRLSLIANWDAAWYAGVSGQYNSFDNTVKAAQVLDDATTAWLRHHLAGDPDYPLPAEPAVARVDEGLFTRFHASCAAGADAAAARVYYTTDAAYTFQGLPLESTGPGTWSAATELLSAVSNDSNLVYFSEITVPVGPAGSGRTFPLTSVPHTYPTFVPVVRPKN